MASKLTFGDWVLRATVQADGACWGIKLRYRYSARLLALGMGSFI
ncbi:MAG: hypothetical protein ACI841_004131 [Planctomycetota bacterium]|jgi:hypothetical protein